MKQTTLEERKIIIHNFKLGKPYRDIAKIVNRSLSTVEYIIKRYNTENRIQRKGRNAPNKIFNAYEERWIVRKIKENSKLSAPRLTQEVEKYLKKTVNPETVRRVLRKNGFYGRTARNKPYVNEKNRKKRLKFAEEYIKEDFSFWKNVIYTDESKFNLFQSDGKINVWRKPREEFKIENLKSTVKHGGGSVMVWGCVSAFGVGSLEFIDGKMNKWHYLNILKRNLKQSAEQMGIKNNYCFYGDNDPKHTSRIAQEWLLHNCPKVIQTPPQSPDLNIIENVWHELKGKIRKHQFSNLSGLKVALEEEWKKISINYCEKLVKSMPRRLEEVIKKRGYPTKY